MEEVTSSTSTASSETVPGSTQGNKSPTWTRIALACVCVSVISSIASIAAYDHWYAQKVVAVDLKGYITQQRDNYVAGKISDDQLRRSLDRLEQVVTSIPKNKAVLMGDLVVRNVEIIKP